MGQGLKFTCILIFLNEKKKNSKPDVLLYHDWFSFHFFLFISNVHLFSLIS